MCTQSVQLKVGLINKCPMGVHALYRNICHIQQYSTAKHLVWPKCVHKSQQKTLQLTRICSDSRMLVPLVLCALLSVLLYKGESSLNMHGPSKVSNWESRKLDHTWDNGYWKKEVKNLALVISCIEGYKQLTEYYTNVCLFVSMGWGLVPAPRSVFVWTVFNLWFYLIFWA